MNGQEQQSVRRRRVFYIPGYDPVPPRRYRELYRKEGARQAEISGYGIDVSARQGPRFGWRATGEMDGVSTEADIDVLVWSDIVQESMSAGILQTYVILARTAYTYIATGALGRLTKLRRGPVIAALYPVGILLAQLFLAVFLGLVIWLVGSALGRPGAWLGALIGGSVVVLLLRYFRKIDGRVFAYYLMHDYGFSAQWRGAEPPALKSRISDFAEIVRDALGEDWDEVLVVGHSSGAHIGVQVLSEVLSAAPNPAVPLSFLSLGQVVPMVSFLPEANDLRRDLRYLSERDDIFWLDVTAPGDPCSFALCDPVAVSGVATDAQKWPLILSAAFTETMDERWREETKFQFFRRHFQYLCSFHKPKDYDYFAVTAGPVTLRERFAAQAPSPSRISASVNRYTGVAR